jgi:predicted component of type VI protein secretion system
LASRCRLRFLFQEFDLPRGYTVIGRGSDCHLTIEDPHVSRKHARILVEDEGAFIEDLGSRNGVRVDGALIAGPTALRDGMRLRIGSQDFLFCTVQGDAKAPDRATGSHRLCASCRSPYPREAPTCPNCEAAEPEEPETLTGVDAPVRVQPGREPLVVKPSSRPRAR